MQQFGFTVTTKLEHLHILSVGNVSSNLTRLQLIVNTLEEHMNTLQIVVIVISKRHNEVLKGDLKNLFRQI